MREKASRFTFYIPRGGAVSAAIMYPLPRTVRMKRGWAGSRSSLWRRRWMWERRNMRASRSSRS